MAEFLFTSPQELASTTILGGNVDTDKYLMSISFVQSTVIEPLLGTQLYDKIYEEAEAGTLSGLYSELYNDFVKPITKFKAMAEYIEVAPYIVNNGGIYKHTGENIEVVDKQEVLFLSNKYNALAQNKIQRFYKWICNNPITEYKTYQDEVSAKRNMKVTAGWKLDGGNNNCDLPWYLQS
jgi:hypothetical protein